MQIIRKVFGLFLWMVVASGSVHAVPTYSVTELGTLGGNGSVGQAINASGQVVGYANIVGGAGGTLHAFLYSDNVMNDLDPNGRFARSDAYDINASGEVVGLGYVSASAGYRPFLFRAFIYSGGALTELGTLGGDDSFAYSINASGQIVGRSSTARNASSRAFLYSGGAMSDLGTLGGNNSFAQGINDSGQVVGSANIAGNATAHAFLYSRGLMIDLGTLGGSYSAAYGINASGQVVGFSDTPGGATHAFLYSGGAMSDLGTLGGDRSAALAINDSGQVVGRSNTALNGPYTPFLYSEGLMKDINSLIDPQSGWAVEAASDINNVGQIVASGCRTPSYCRALRLDPVSNLGPTVSEPEILSLMLAELGILGLVYRRRQKQLSS